ncbi:MAG: anthranilate phosphoribosyltransferase [Methanobrevibacter sp.]|nr:anthranilate phosphoribosyltransferase [Methanobrevibacter sp.]
MIKEAILKVSKKEDLTYDEAFRTMDEIMSGEASEVQMSSYLTAMSMKGETIDEITASAEAMRAHCVRLLNDVEALEIVGTGGDGSNTFNISTTSSIVISAAGVPVAKHGNRSASSKCGAADVLEQLGVNIQIEPDKSLSCLKKNNICFLFAQNYHIAMKYVASVRKELAIRTIFNILGPLTNPAGATMQVLGVYDKELVEPLAEVLNNLGVESALSVYGMDGMDEISASDETFVCEIKDGKTKSYMIKPEDFGFERCKKEDLVGGNPRENAKITLGILNGQKGPKRNAVVLNSAAGLYVAGAVESINDGVKLAEEIIDSGKALEQLEKFIDCTNG